MRNKILVLMLLAVASVEAATFTAVQRRHDDWNVFFPESTLTLTVSEHSDQVKVTVRRDRVFIWNYGPWPPPIALLFNGADARNGYCDDPALLNLVYGTCEGDLAVRHREDGKSEFYITKETLLEAVSRPWRIKKRYDTCLSTNGRVDTEYPGFICPRVGFRSIDISYNTVSPPFIAWLVSIQIDESDRREFLFLASEEETQADHQFRVGLSGLPEENRPLPEHYGGLNRLIAWYEMASGEPESEEPE
ncbi:MAG: hypothetical protein F4X39_09385, partial [Acidobacteriia bacterium]|nr:hypothetical protein [Terriglobia bacterium]